MIFGGGLLVVVSGKSWRSTGMLSGLEDLRGKRRFVDALKRCHGVWTFSERCAMFGLLEDFVQKRREACKMDGLQGVSSL